MFTKPYTAHVVGIGTQYVFEYDNGYGASVIDYGYGAGQGLFELAVMKDNDLCYDTVITDDTIGHLTVEGVNALLKRIESL